jgi:tetratricopeptide (TPR) repeat protein
MNDDRETGVIVPFQQNAEFYYQRGSKYLSQPEDLAKAEQYLRKAYEAEPAREEYILAFAETLYRMHRFEESLSVLLTSLNDTTRNSHELIFGIGSVFMGLEEFHTAEQCFRLCLDRDPNGPFADRALDALELIEDEPELAAQIGLIESEDVALLDAIHRAKSMFISNGDDSGLKLLLSVADRYPNSEMLDMEIAIMQFSIRKYDEAKKRLFNLFKRNSKSVRGNALLTLIYHVQKQDREAQEQSKKILIDPDCSPEELGYAAPILMEIGQYDRARYALELLRDALPYDTEMLHQLAFCCYMQGRKHDAEAIYDDLAQRNEEDSVAAYYKKHIREDAEADFKRSWTINYDVPVREAIVRQRRIRDVATAGVEAVRQTWTNDREFRMILKWALMSPMSPSVRGTAKMLSIIGTPEAERELRSFLIRFDQTDEDKQFVFGLLLGMEAKPPFSLYYQGEWQYGIARPMVVPPRLPVSYESILGMISDFPDCVRENIRYRDLKIPQELTDVSTRIFFFYLSCFKGEALPHISRMQEDAMAGAFLVMGLGALNAASIDPAVILDVFDLTARRLENALKRILTTMHRDKES